MNAFFSQQKENLVAAFFLLTKSDTFFFLKIDQLIKLHCDSPERRIELWFSPIWK